MQTVKHGSNTENSLLINIIQQSILPDFESFKQSQQQYVQVLALLILACQNLDLTSIYLTVIFYQTNL